MTTRIAGHLRPRLPAPVNQQRGNRQNDSRRPAHLSTPDGLINTDHSTSSNTIPHSTTACFSVFLTHDSLYRRLCGSNSSTSTFSQWCSPHQTPASSSVSVTSQKNGECSKGC